MTDDLGPRGPLDQALDLFVYLPVGFVLDLPSSLPRSIERGRVALRGNDTEVVASATSGSGTSTSTGTSAPADSPLERLQAHAHRTLRALGIGTTADEARGPLPASDIAAPASPSSATPEPVAPEPAAPEPAAARRAADVVDVAPELSPTSGSVVAGATTVAGIAVRVDTGSTPRNGSSASAVEVPAPDVLAIPGYDSLSASQVVPRLESLNADELEQVRHYEQANRGRKTILSKIAQLQA